MSLYKQFETDTSVERDGLWLAYGQNSKKQPIEIKIARAGGSNEAYLKKLEAKFKPFKRLIQNDALDRPIYEKLVRETYAETVLLDWKGVEDRDGNDMVFSKENALTLLNDLPDLYADILEQSTKAALFRKELREADAKN
jgi:hypothetical protein